MRSVNQAKRLGAKLRKPLFNSDTESEEEEDEQPRNEQTVPAKGSSIANVSSNWATLGVHVTFEDAAELCEDVEAAQSMPTPALCTLWDSSSDDSDADSVPSDAVVPSGAAELLALRFATNLLPCGQSNL